MHFPRDLKKENLLTPASDKAWKEWLKTAKYDPMITPRELEKKQKEKENGVYAFVIEGDVTINGKCLNRRDGMRIKETDKLEIKADNNAELLLMEVPV